MFRASLMCVLGPSNSATPWPRRSPCSGSGYSFDIFERCGNDGWPGLHKQARSAVMQEFGDKLTDPAFFAAEDAHPLWKRMRAEDPVHRATGNLRRGFWSIDR